MLHKKARSYCAFVFIKCYLQIRYIVGVFMKFTKISHNRSSVLSDNFIVSVISNSTFL